MELSGGTTGSKLYIVIGAFLFPFSKLVFNDLRAVLLRGRIIILPLVLSLFVNLFINMFLFLGTWIFTPLGFIYLYILNKREQTHL